MGCVEQPVEVAGLSLEYMICAGWVRLTERRRNCCEAGAMCKAWTASAPICGIPNATTDALTVLAAIWFPGGLFTKSMARHTVIDSIERKKAHAG